MIDMTIGGGAAGLALFLGWLAAAWLLAARRERAAPALWQTALLGDRPMPPWDGQTWDWPEGHLGEYFFGDPYAYDDEPRPAAPADQTTLASPGPYDEPARPQPYPGDDPYLDDEADRFIQAMRDHTDAFITAMSRPALAPAGASAGW
jgi:hypothetical protein